VEDKLLIAIATGSRYKKHRYERTLKECLSTAQPKPKLCTFPVPQLSASMELMSNHTRQTQPA
jgi:hypothetical protein